MSQTQALAKPDDAATVNPLALLKHVMEQGIEPAQLKEMFDLANQWQDREAGRVFGDALAGFQAECPPIVKTRDVLNKADGHGNRSLRYKFASLDDVDQVVRPILAKYRISTSGTINVDADAVRVVWVIQCGSHKERREFALPKIAASGIVQGGNATQDMGAWMSYLRRYTFCMALNVVVTGEDSDANSMGDLLVITETQLAEVRALIAQERMDEKRVAKMLGWLGADSVETITQSQFRKLLGTMRKAGAA